MWILISNYTFYSALFKNPPSSLNTVYFYNILFTQLDNAMVIYVIYSYNPPQKLLLMI